MIMGFQVLSFTSEQLGYYITRMPYMIVWIGAIAFMSIRVSIYQVYLQQVVSFGSRRIEVFWGTQAMDVIIIVGISILYVIMQKIALVLGYSMIPFSKNFVLLFSKGVIAFMLLCGLVGGLSGFAYSMLQGGKTLNSIQLPSNLALIGVCISMVIYLIGILLEYNLLKKYEVRV